MKTRFKLTDAINIVTMGCSKNLVDSEYLMRQLDASGLRIVHNAGISEARTVIINTCGFINDAKQESIDSILQHLKAKEQGLIDKVYVMGCLSERYKKELPEEIPEVDKYFGVNDLSDVVKTIGADYKKELAGERILTTPRHYAYLKISEGCDRTCSFCAIPMIRGKHKSRSVEELISEAEILGKQGVKELILIAQDLTYYGVDLYRKQLLPDLLKRLSDLPYFTWIRLHYAYPSAFPKDVVTVMKERKNICRYLDIPLQHISDTVLRNMKRSHNKRQTTDLIGFIRSEVPDITLRTTLLVGHPGEGEKEFLELVDFVREFRFERLGAFMYSEEENTFAARNFKDSIPLKIKKQREEQIMLQQQEISRDINEAKTGKTIDVIIDKCDEHHSIGRTQGDSPEVDNEVIIKQSNLPIIPGNFYKIKITSADDYDLFGEVIS